MIKTKLDFLQVKVEMMFGDTAILVQPVFCKTPEAFNAIDIITPLRLPFTLFDYNMVAANRQTAVSMPIIGIIKSTWLNVFFNYRQKSILLREEIGKVKTLPFR
jgi:hypothetical protein